MRQYLANSQVITSRQSNASCKHMHTWALSIAASHRYNSCSAVKLMLCPKYGLQTANINIYHTLEWITAKCYVTKSVYQTRIVIMTARLVQIPRQLFIDGVKRERISTRTAQHMQQQVTMGAFHFFVIITS